MLKKEVTYKNFDDETETKVLYFNLTAAEVVDGEFLNRTEESFSALIERMTKSKSPEDLVMFFDRILRMSYGERDGDRHVKSQEIWERFKQTLAYAALYEELVFSENPDQTMGAFINGLIPSDLVARVEAQNAERQRQIDAAKTDTDRQAEAAGVSIPPPVLPPQYIPTTPPHPPYS